jgi:hypothetical protein
MKRLLLPIFFALTCSLFAQTTEQKFSLEWSTGKIIFKSGDTLLCNLRFNQTGTQHLLQLNHDNEIITVPIKHVQSFSYFDSRKNRNRVYSAFQHAHLKDQEYYMERIYTADRISILNHKTMEVPEELNFSRFIAKPVKTYKKYLFQESTGELLPLSRESLFTVLQARREEILSYVKEKGIRFRRISDFIEVLEYHNSL